MLQFFLSNLKARNDIHSFFKTNQPSSAASTSSLPCPSTIAKLESTQSKVATRRKLLLSPTFCRLQNAHLNLNQNQNQLMKSHRTRTSALLLNRPLLSLFLLLLAKAEFAAMTVTLMVKKQTLS